MHEAAYLRTKDGIEFGIYGPLLARRLRSQEEVCETHDIAERDASGLLSTISLVELRRCMQTRLGLRVGHVHRCYDT